MSYETSSLVGNGSTCCSSACEIPCVPGIGSSSKKCSTVAGRGLPPDVLHLPRLRLSLVVAIGFGRVVVVARLGLPRAHDLRVERPVRNVDALDGVDQRAGLQTSRRQPLALVPAADLLADGGLGDLERQQALRPDRRLDLLVVDELRRSAELAALPDALRIEDRDRLAAPALHRAPLGLPAAQIVRHLAQRAHQVQLQDLSGRADVVGGLGAAERAHELLLAGIPLGLCPARRARVLLERDGSHLLREVFVERRALDPPGRADLLARQLARFEDREHVAFRHLERVRHIAW